MDVDGSGGEEGTDLRGLASGRGREEGRHVGQGSPSAETQTLEKQRLAASERRARRWDVGGEDGFLSHWHIDGI